MILPPKIGLVFLAILSCIWSQQHPVAARADSGWILPVEPPATLVNTYRAPATAYASGHRGLDYGVVNHAQLLAPFDGKVRFVGQVAHKPVIALVHDGGYITSFEPACGALKLDQQVKKGQVIGFVCGERYKSHCASLCLHYGMKIAGNYLSPLALAGALAPSHTI